MFHVIFFPAFIWKLLYFPTRGRFKPTLNQPTSAGAVHLFLVRQSYWFVKRFINTFSDWYSNDVFIYLFFIKSCGLKLMNLQMFVF